jgi:hypothetical protein
MFLLQFYPYCTRNAKNKVDLGGSGNGSKVRHGYYHHNLHGKVGVTYLSIQYYDYYLFMPCRQLSNYPHYLPSPYMDC